MKVLRLRDGQRWLDAAPAWSTLSAVGWFSLAKAGFRFDRHFHDCAEYWAITGYQTVPGTPCHWIGAYFAELTKLVPARS